MLVARRTKEMYGETIHETQQSCTSCMYSKQGDGETDKVDEAEVTK